MKIVTGKHKESLDAFRKIRSDFSSYNDCVELAILANIHLNNYGDALELGKKEKEKQVEYLENRARKPFTVISDRTYTVPFLVDEEIPSTIWPGVMGTINGTQSKIRFDTGADYLVMGLTAAKKFGLELGSQQTGSHGTARVSSWQSTVNRVDFFEGPSFLNVPAKVMADLGDHVIFGTNIVEQFLSTIDYNNHRFIFTQRGETQSIEEHRAIFRDGERIPFLLWGDHYMIAKGTFGEHEGLNLFVDSGLIALTEIDGKLLQAPFTASREALVRWGFDIRIGDPSSFFQTGYSLSLGNLSQKNALLWYDKNLEKDRTFGGIRIDGLISHAWLRNYVWTIDFDSMEYIFTRK